MAVLFMTLQVNTECHDCITQALLTANSAGVFMVPALFLFPVNHISSLSVINLCCGKCNFTEIDAK